MKIRDLGFEFDDHNCDSRREGDWLIFECQKCTYVRKINFKTREMKVTHGDPTALHRGFRKPVGIQPGKINLN